MVLVLVKYREDMQTALQKVPSLLMEKNIAFLSITVLTIFMVVQMVSRTRFGKAENTKVELSSCISQRMVKWAIREL